MASSMPRKRKKAADYHITKFFRVVTPTTETSSGRTGLRNPSDGHVSDSDSESDSEPEDQNTGGGDADAGPNEVEQPPGIQPDSDSVNDLGLILRGAMTDNEVSRAILALTPGQKYTLLTDHFKPSQSFIFPILYSNGCHRSFQQKWLDKYPWLVYSKEVDGWWFLQVLCTICYTRKYTGGACKQTISTMGKGHQNCGWSCIQ